MSEELKPREEINVHKKWIWMSDWCKGRALSPMDKWAWGEAEKAWNVRTK